MWYREGTKSLVKGSDIVIGVGTSWSKTENGVLPGMILLGKNGEPFEIKSVESDTKLTLVEPYDGVNVADIPCRIVTTYQGDISQFAARFAAQLQSMNADSGVIRAWLTSGQDATLLAEDGTKITLKALRKIIAEHDGAMAWFTANQDAILTAAASASKAAASALAASSSQKAAKTSETNAAGSASTAASSKSAAATSATNAATSESNAAISEGNAKTSESNAASSAKSASSSATSATASKGAAAVSENNASASETNAAAFAASAAGSKTDSATSANNAAKSSAAAKTSEVNAAASEANAKKSENAAAASQSSTAGLAKNAATSEINAERSASAAKNAEANSESYKSAASISATSASTSETNAGASKDAAFTFATNAAKSASDADKSAKNAGKSESNAMSSENSAAKSESSSASSASSAKTSENNAAASAAAAAASAKSIDADSLYTKTNLTTAVLVALGLAPTKSPEFSGTTTINGGIRINGKDASQGITVNSLSPAVAFVDSSDASAAFRWRGEANYLSLDVDNQDNGATWNNNYAHFSQQGHLALAGGAGSNSRMLTLGAGTAGNKMMAGTTQIGGVIYANVGSDATSRAIGWGTEMTVGDGVTEQTLSDWVEFWGNSQTVNDKATVTLMSSFRSYDKAKTNVAQAIAFDGRQMTRAGVMRWNLYMQGTAPNFIRGQTILGGADVTLPDSAYNLEVRGGQRITGDLVVEGMIYSNKNDGGITFTSVDGTGPVYNINYSSAGNFGFWDKTNSAWLLRNDAKNNWIMPASLSVNQDLDVTSSINSQARINIIRSDGRNPYQNFVRRDLPSDKTPTNETEIGQVFFRTASPTSDPYAGRVLGMLQNNMTPSGGGKTFLDARNKSGGITSRLILDGDQGMATINGDIYSDGNITTKGNFDSSRITFTSGGAAGSRFFDYSAGNQLYIGDNGIFNFYNKSKGNVLSVDSTKLETTLKGTVKVSGEVQTTTANGFRIVQGEYGAFLRNDGADTYFLLTNRNDQYGNWNGLRPFRFNNSNGYVTIENGVQINGNAAFNNDVYVAGNGNFNDVHIRSDRRNKRNISKIEGALDKLEKIDGVLYELQGIDGFHQSAGLVAQQVQEVQPELVTSDIDHTSQEERLRLNYNGVIGMLVEAVKELRAEVKELKEAM